MHKSTPFNAYVTRTSQQQAKAGVEERLSKADQRKRDLEALEALQKTRPSKPPTRKR